MHQIESAEGKRENFFGAVVTRNPVDQTWTLQHVAGLSTDQAVLEVALQGVTLGTHRVLVQVNRVNSGEVIFNGQENKSAKFTVPHSRLREGENTVRLIALNGPSDVCLVDYIRIFYQRAYAADGDRLKCTAAGREQVTARSSLADRYSQ